MDIPNWNILEERLSEALGLERVIRWQKYVKRGEARRENSLQHTYAASLLAIAVLENERRYSDFDPYLVLKGVIVHDIGEIQTGDTVYMDKSDGVDQQEYCFFREFMSEFPDSVRGGLEEAYNLQHAGKQWFSKMADRLGQEATLEFKLFDAIERLGYVIFAYREYRNGNEKIFVQTLRNQHPHLVRLAMELPGFGKEFYSQMIQDSVEAFLKGYEGRYTEQKGE